MPVPSMPALDPDACYLALLARDARFDGRFFTGVTSTGVYCRPICGVRTPRRENCRFFRYPAQAEREGFRPCLRCRPELAPGATPAWSSTDAGEILVGAAVRLLDTPAGGVRSVGGLARALGVSERHLRRLFEERLGVSPMQYLQTRRLLAAKQWLTDSHLPMAQVAQLAGFGSLRRFNDAIRMHYRLTPGQLRRQAKAGTGTPEPDIVVRLGWRPPYDVAAVLGFLQRRAIAGVERVDVAGGTAATLPGLWRTLHLHAHDGRRHVGWIDVRLDAARHQAVVRVPATLAPVLPAVIHRVRALLDLDADPQVIQAVLKDMPGAAGRLEGVRVPGCVDGFELAVRAVLGQRISVAAARTLVARLVTHLGERLDPDTPDRLWFPSPQRLAAASPEQLGRLGITRQAQAALLAIARAVCEGRLDLDHVTDPPAAMAELCTLPGVGAWTAHYIAMRALRWPDAFPAGDVALHRALGLAGPRAAAQAEAMARAWQPWRSYAVMRAWTAAALPTSSPTNR